MRARGGVAATVDEDLSALFRVNFEDGMAAFRVQRDVDTTAFIREMAQFLVTFRPGPGNFYTTLFRRLGNRLGSSVVIATTNYDLLIELALAAAGRRIKYAIGGEPGPGVPLLKIHGSANFVLDTGVKMIGVKFANNAVNVDAPVRAANLHELEHYFQTEDSTAPAMALYAKGKAVLFGPGAVKQQLDEFHASIERAARIFVIGLRVNEEDTHIWTNLAATKAPVYYVSPERDRYAAWSRHCRGKRYHLAETFAEAVRLIPSILSA